MGRLAWSLVALLLLVPMPTAAETVVEATFARHAQIEGETSARNLHWALLIFDGPHSEASFTMHWDGQATLTNITHADGQYGAGPPPTFQVPALDYPQNRTLEGPVQAQFSFPRSWGSLYIEAEDLQLEANGTRLDTDRIFAGDDLRSRLPDVKMPTSAANYPPMLPGEGLAVAVAHTTPGTDFPFGLKASGVHYLAWHNSTMACATAACPDSGRTTRLAAPAPVSLWFAVNPYISVQVPGGAIRGAGTSLVGVVGGTVLDLRAHGVLRLPEADLMGHCPKGPCPNPSGRTFLATGDFRLKDLGPVSDANRLRTELSGDFTSASFDEAPVSNFRVAAVAAAGATLVGLFFLLKYLWARLFVRSARPPALESPRRRAVFETIQAEPGVSFRELQRRLGWPHGTLRNHVQRLLEAGIITAHPHRNTVRYFENHGTYKDRWLPTAHLQDADTRQLHEWLVAHPAAGQSQVTRETESWGWTRAKTRRRLADLEEAGLLTTTRQGNRVRYQARGPPAPPQPSMAAA